MGSKLLWVPGALVPVKAAHRHLAWGDTSLTRDVPHTVEATPDEIAALPHASQVAAHQEGTCARALVSLWQAHSAAVSRSALAHALGPRGVDGDILGALKMEALYKAQTATLQPLLVKAIQGGAVLGAVPLRAVGIHVRGLDRFVEKASLTIDLAAISEEAIAWAKSHAGDLVEAPQAIKDQVRTIIVRAQELGLSPDRTAQLLRDVIGLDDARANAVMNFQQRLIVDGVPEDKQESRVSRYADAQLSSRAWTIARTELIASTNGGQQMLWDKAVEKGVIKADQFQKEWITTPDELLCDDCEELDGEQVDIDGDFSDGEDGPPDHPNCRCAVGLVDAEDSDKDYRPTAKDVRCALRLILGPTLADELSEIADPLPRHFRIERDAHGRLTRLVEES